eukprot:TRINITY_DN62608_c0_g1_i1.p1 TRINITY_DN62608_c0_g1~~TRINITY_DN62608_c0_g1_i1.p1  ORF type:complete len:469 (+),score=45.59 TRINITY_DN62608_c0_g1_i1:28-1434(+)
MARKSIRFVALATICVLGHAWKSSVHRCCVGQTWRIAMGPDTFSPYIYYNNVPMNESHQPAHSSYTGFIPDIIDELSKEMGFQYVYLTRPLQEMYHQSGGVAALTQMANGSYDAVGAFLDNPELSSVSDFVLTSPILTASNLALVRRSTVQRDLWSLFNPFALETWLAMMGGLVGFLFVSTVITAQTKGLRAATDPGFVCSSFYHIWSALFGQDDNTWESCPMRLLRLGLLFFSLVMMSTYTASLASWLVRPDVEIHGPKSMVELLSARATYHDPSYAFTVEPFVGKLTLPDAVTTFENKLDWMLQLLKQDEVDVLVTNDSPALDLWLGNCDSTAIVPSINFSPWYWALAVRTDELGLNFARDVTIAMSRFVSTSVFQSLETRWLSRGKTCAEQQISTSGAVQVSSMQGTFLISFAVGALAIIAAVFGRFLIRAKVVEEGDFVEPEGEARSRELDNTDSLEAACDQHD